MLSILFFVKEDHLIDGRKERALAMERQICALSAASDYAQK